MTGETFRPAVPRLALLCLLCTVGLAACGRLPSFPGTGIGGAQPDAALPYRATVAGSETDPALFTVAVAAPGAPLAATRESLRFPAVRYCLSRFGSSEIVWDAPTGAPRDWTGRIAADGRTVYTGRCAGR